MGKKKVAYQLTVDVPQSLVNDFVKSAEEFLLYDYDLEMSLKDHPTVIAAIQKSLQQELNNLVSEIYTDEIVYTLNLEKTFKKQIAVAEKKMAEQRAADIKAAEDARRAVSGILRMNPDDIKKAKSLLEEAGIKVAQ